MFFSRTFTLTSGKNSQKPFCIFLSSHCSPLVCLLGRCVQGESVKGKTVQVGGVQDLCWLLVSRYKQEGHQARLCICVSESVCVCVLCRECVPVSPVLPGRQRAVVDGQYGGAVRHAGVEEQVDAGMVLLR